MNGDPRTHTGPATPPRSRLILAAPVACFLAVGLPYWGVPYDQVALPTSLYGPGLVLVAGCALLLTALGAARFGKATLLVGLAVPAAVMVRVVVDVLGDPTSHNLWPLEIVISLIVGLVVAAAGALVGTLIARMRGRG